MKNINTYISNLNTQYKTGISTEHTFRADLQNLIQSIENKVLVTNEPTRVSCGAPDYIITKKDIPVGYIEAKDIGTELNNKVYQEQFDRYKKSLTNLIITDYLTFHLFRDGELVSTISIGEIQRDKIYPIPGNFQSFSNLIKEFCSCSGQTITSASKLATMMANKARLLADIIENAIIMDEKRGANSINNSLLNQLKSFKDVLIHDITQKDFADIYSQTIAYGMFAARLHDGSLENFTRSEAAELIPKSNPFLRKLFQYIAGFELDDRIKWIVDSLADVFRATDIKALLKDFGKATQQNDPMIHFYETFLSEYDPKLRKSRGVWYTPEPVVNFIVRAVDDILKSEFIISKGLADTSKVKIKVEQQGNSFIDEFHKIQILDPAAGTGTFLTEVIRQIYKKFEGQKGIWDSYVSEHLIPRLNGFEILMASYAMAHLKLDLLLKETGYNSRMEQRFRVYMTNSLEEHHPDTGTLFAYWLSAEANEANHIKRDAPIMIVLGNPPYRGESVNKGEWIMQLMEDYKKEPGKKEKLKEKNSKWINDDYVKFIRYGQYFINRNGEGILAFINPHGFLDNTTFRGMRWNLLKTFDMIYTIDLHGDSKKREKAKDGSKDENVFDIKQGVSINLFIKTGKKKNNELSKVFRYDIYGRRDSKYEFLRSNSISTIQFERVDVIPPDYFYANKELKHKNVYQKYFQISELFKVGNSGVVSKRDKLNIHFTKDDVVQMISDFNSLKESVLRTKYSIPEDVRDWNFTLAKKDLIDTNSDPSLITQINYRPFDKRYFYYSGKSKGIVGWPVPVVSEHLKYSDNLGLMLNKKIEVGDFAHGLIYRGIVESHAISMKEINYVFPLYLYPANRMSDQLINNEVRVPNLNLEIVSKIAEKISLIYENEKVTKTNTFSPIDILDYIYAILYSPTYRKKYNEYLKIGFPKIPYPKDSKVFLSLAKYGGELRLLHLLESPIVNKFITKYPIKGNNIVCNIKYKNEKVYINETQYFEGISLHIWNFYLGGYQPAQKWLKDRKDRELNFEDINHYQKIIVALSETEKIMKEIDKLGFEK